MVTEPRALAYSPERRQAFDSRASGVIVFGGAAALALLLNLGGFSAAGAERTGVEASPYIWLRLGESALLDDGRARQEISVEFVQWPKPGGEANVFYRQTPLPAYNAGETPGLRLWRRSLVRADADGLFVCRILADAFCRVEVWARVDTGDGTFYAQTAFNLYGQAESPAPAGGEIPEPEDLPRFALVSSGESYWPQTGHEFTVRPEWPGGEALSRLSARAEDGTELAALARGRDGGFSYRPPPDRDLDRAGAAAKKQIVFVAGENGEGGANSFSLAIHRSRSGNLDLVAGLELGAAALAAAVGFAVLRRRKAAAR